MSEKMVWMIKEMDVVKEKVGEAQRIRVVFYGPLLTFFGRSLVGFPRSESRLLRYLVQPLVLGSVRMGAFSPVLMGFCVRSS